MTTRIRRAAELKTDPNAQAQPKAQEEPAAKNISGQHKSSQLVERWMGGPVIGFHFNAKAGSKEDEEDTSGAWISNIVNRVIADATTDLVRKAAAETVVQLTHSDRNSPDYNS